MAEDDVATLNFTITREGSSARHAPKKFALKLGAETPIRIGRAPGNDILVESRGVSQYHAELRLVRTDDDPCARLCVRDLSMNGTGLKKLDGKTVHLEKRADVPLVSGSVLLVPMMMKVSQPQSERAWLRVSFEGTEAVGGTEGDSTVPAARDDGEDEGPSPVPVPGPPVPAPVRPEVVPAGGQNGGHSDDGSGPGAAAGDEDVEKSRMRFVELLLKTREVNASTTYEEAKALLAENPDWFAVDESTRKECFDIFVEHLGSHASQKKKDKKKGKEKDKEKSKKKNKEEAEDEGQKGAAEAKAEPKEKKRRDRKGGASRSGSADRKRKREKPRRSGSPAASPPREKRRRRGGRSGSA